MTVDDRLDLGLRGHFQAVADRRAPADLVAAVVSRTATIHVRPTWYVALRGDLVRPTIGFVGRTRYAWLALALLLLAAFALGTFVGGRGSGTPFEGRWTSMDFDGSTQMLVVGRGPTPPIGYTDSFATACQNNGDADTSWEGSGKGVLTRNRLRVVYGRGGCTTWFVDADVVTYDWDSAADTLLDSRLNTWHRVR
jgi:hypothetical protein